MSTLDDVAALARGLRHHDRGGTDPEEMRIRLARTLTEGTQRMPVRPSDTVHPDRPPEHERR